MPDQEPGRVFLGVAVQDYLPSAGLGPLDGARDQMDELAGKLREFGFRTTRVDDPTLESLRDRLAEWRAETVGADRPAAALVAWSSHARTDDDRQLQLLVTDSDPAFSDTSYEPSKLAEHARAVADQVLIVLDTCYAGAGTVEVVRKTIAAWAHRSLPPGRRAWLGVLAAAQPNEPADGQGMLIEQLTRLLTDGPTGAYRARWAVRTRGITGSDLIQAVHKEWPDDCGQRPVDVQTGDALPVFRNPRWRPANRPELVEHLVRAAQGADRLDEGWFFTGRHDVLTEIVDWLRQPRPCICTVTGPAGCGKSAVVGRIAALSDSARRADLSRHAPLSSDDPDPGEGSVDAAVHLRGLDVAATITALAHDLGLAQPATPAELIAEVSHLAAPPVIILDGLDEAAPVQAGQLRMDLVEPLGRVAKVLLATRTRAYEARLVDGRDAAERIDAGLSMVPQDSRVVDLAEAPHTQQDITEYVRRRLTGSGHPDDQVESVAQEVARRAVSDAGGFLYARIVTGTLARQVGDFAGQDWAALLGGSIAEAFAADLATVDPVLIDGRPVTAAGEDLLRALAWAQGRGLPAGEIWQSMATALGTAGVTYGPDAVDAVLERYGRYIVEDDQDGRAVYRLYHRELVTHLRQVTPAVAGRPAAEVAADTVFRLLLAQTDEGRRADQADPYLRRYLSAYAVQAGARGVAPLRQLAATNPDAWLPDLARSLNNLGVRLSELGRRQEALAPTEEAVTIYRRLAASNPEAWLPDLAGSLNNLGVRLSRLGRRQEALASTEEAVTIYRGLAASSDLWSLGSS
jgi:tetratricopeptide (TPR) repeat protein